MDQEQLEKAVRRAFETHEAAALVHVEPLVQMLQDNPDKAIDFIFKTYNKALNDAYTDNEGKNMRAFIEAIAGGPFEGIPRQVYNAVGEVYPYLERSQKDRALRQVLNCMDGLNYVDVNGLRGAGHTPGIREPLLLSDIQIVRWIYWPGLHDEEYLWKDKESFQEIKDEIIDKYGLFRRDKVKSDFLVAYALLRSNLCRFGEDYAQAANPNFLERVLKGIVAMRFAHAENEEDVIEGTKRLEFLLPKSVHNRIESLRLERDWVDHAQPHFR